MPEVARYPWDFKPGQSMAPDFRQAHALEYIAHYLDRIEQHLAKISSTLTEDPADDITVLSALKDVSDSIKGQA